MFNFNQSWHQTEFTINGLIDSDILINEKIWLKQNEIFLQVINGTLYACTLEYSSDLEVWLNRNETLQLFVEFSSILLNKHVSLIRCKSQKLRSEKTFGEKIWDLEPVDENQEKIQISLDNISTKLSQNMWWSKYVGNISGEPKSDQQRRKDGKTESELIKKLISIYKICTPIIQNNSYLKIPLFYLSNFFEKSLYSNTSFVNLVTGMEALYSDGSSEMSYKLRIRASFLLSMLGRLSHDPPTIFMNMKDAYNKRSKIVHGEVIDKITPTPILSYLRLSLLIMVILHMNSEIQNRPTSKDEILRKIDMAMLSTWKRKNLRKEIQTQWKDLQPVVTIMLDELPTDYTVNHFFKS